VQENKVLVVHGLLTSYGALRHLERRNPGQREKLCWVWRCGWQQQQESFVDG